MVYSSNSSRFNKMVYTNNSNRFNKIPAAVKASTPFQAPANSEVAVTTAVPDYSGVSNEAYERHEPVHIEKHREKDIGNRLNIFDLNSLIKSIKLDDLILIGLIIMLISEGNFDEILLILLVFIFFMGWQF